jgi:diguanylate cyclase (GGDEF)-like protein
MHANGHQIDSSFQVGLSNHRPRRRVLTIDRGSRSVQKSLEENLTSALQAADGEFGDILHEVDEISRILKSENPDKQTLQIASHPAVWSAVKQALLDRELRYLAVTDDLTSLYNRRGFFAAATQLLKLATRNTNSLLLLFCDFDNLKEINDTFGHREGDLALIRTADALEHTFRSADVLARIGGDEFAVLAMETSEQGEELFRRRLEKSLKKANAGETRFQLSVSVGAARFDPKRAVSLGELMLEADQAMYEEKRKRRKATQTQAKHSAEASV